MRCLRQVLVSSVLLLASLAITIPVQGLPDGNGRPSSVHAKTFTIAGGKFLLDGQPFTFISGEMHYARIPSAYWRQRLRMARACGLNAITTYVFWNVHEPEKGRFNFKGEADLARFIRIAQEEGLWVILRPGPYVCAEWDFGGFPYWLLNEKGLTLRSRDPRFMQYTERYLRELGKQLVPLQVDHGGNILLVQVENEYGSYSNDKIYMGQVRDAVLKAGFTVPLYTCDGGSQMPAGYLPGLLPGLNGGSGPEVKETIDRFYPGGPYMVPEYYPGWLDHWGEPKSRVGADGVVRNTERMLEAGISFNYYMFHGGTNFGFTNGANFGGNYQPDITSYDYDAPLDEAGHATPKYLKIREAILKHLPPAAPITVKLSGRTATVTPLPPIPPSPPVVAVPRFTLTEAGSLAGALPQPILSANLKTMEEVGQDYGFILYRTTLRGPLSGKLSLKGLRDYAVVTLNGRRIGLLDRRRGIKPLPIEAPGGDATLDILVENCGRINYGPLLTDNHKGITDSVQFGGKTLTGWKIYRLPFRSVTDLALDGKETEGPMLRRGRFHLDRVGDTYLDMRGWYKGVAWINGHNLGRFWQIGPQQALYVPGCWLKPGDNEVTLLDLAPNGQRDTGGLDHPILDELHPEEPVRKPRPAPAKLPVPTAAEKVAEGEFTAGDDQQNVAFGAQTGRYLCFEALTSYDGDYGSCAELYLLDAQGKPLPRDTWSIYYADSEETSQEDGSADNMIDDDPATIWHSVWSESHTPLPHRVVIDLGKETTFSGARYLARRGDKPGKTRRYAFYVSKTPFTKAVSIDVQAGHIVQIVPPEQGFFSKKLDFEGIPIKAHADVADSALYAGRDRLALLLKNLPEERRKLAAAGAQLHIIGKDQVTSDLPEFRHLKGKPFDGNLTVDQRTRGLGGLLTSCGEENLLKLPGDRYAGRDICIHEFAHNLQDTGLSSGLRAKIRAQYRSSLDKGLWKGAYAATNVSEYWAELTMWYFGTHGDLHMTGVKPANGRDGLKQYDPDAYALLDAIYSGRLHE